MARLFLFICSANNILNVSLMCLLRTIESNLMNRLSCTQASQDVSDAAGNMESKQTPQPRSSNQPRSSKHLVRKNANRGRARRPVWMPKSISTVMLSAYPLVKHTAQQFEISPFFVGGNWVSKKLGMGNWYWGQSPKQPPKKRNWLKAPSFTFVKASWEPHVQFHISFCWIWRSSKSISPNPLSGGIRTGI